MRRSNRQEIEYLTPEIILASSRDGMDWGMCEGSPEVQASAMRSRQPATTRRASQESKENDYLRFTIDRKDKRCRSFFVAKRARSEAGVVEVEVG